MPFCLPRSSFRRLTWRRLVSFIAAPRCVADLGSGSLALVLCRLGSVRVALHGGTLPVSLWWWLRAPRLAASDSSSSSFSGCLFAWLSLSAPWAPSRVFVPNIAWPRRLSLLCPVPFVLEFLLASFYFIRIGWLKYDSPRFYKFLIEVYLFFPFRSPVILFPIWQFVPRGFKAVPVFAVVAIGALLRADAP